MMFSSKPAFPRHAAFLLSIALIGTTPVTADETKIECTLYIAESMDSVASHSVAVDSASTTLATLRRVGYCVSADGAVTDKQFVMVNRITDKGARGTTQGYSIYTMANGDSISAQFTGGWNNGPFSGTYEILGGTGAYNEASGDGTIQAIDSAWQTTGVVEIVLNINTP